MQTVNMLPAFYFQRKPNSDCVASTAWKQSAVVPTPFYNAGILYIRSIHLTLQILTYSLFKAGATVWYNVYVHVLEAWIEAHRAKKLCVVLFHCIGEYSKFSPAFDKHQNHLKQYYIFPMNNIDQYID